MANLPEIRFLNAGDTMLVVEFGQQVDRHISELVLALAERLEAAALPGVVELVPTFRSLAVHYEPLRISQSELKQRLAPLLQGLAAAKPKARRWRIPACFEETFALDLAEVAKRTGVGTERVVDALCATSLRVYMVGFLPGFPYLGDLPKELELPRRENPRVKLPAGSIAIATTLAAIYPVESPGGWHIIGRSPIPLWDLRRGPPSLLAAGDEIRFAPVSIAEYERLAATAAKGALRLEPEIAGAAEMIKQQQSA